MSIELFEKVTEQKRRKSFLLNWFAKLEKCQSKGKSRIKES